MHYLDVLAERLVLAYNEEKIFKEQGASMGDREKIRAILSHAMRRILEREVADGRLSYQVFQPFSKPMEFDSLTTLRND